VMCGKAAGELIMAEYPEEALSLNMKCSRMSAMRMLADDLRFHEGFAAVGITLPLRDPESWMDKLWADQAGREDKDIHWAGRVWEAAFVARTAARLGEQEVGIRLMEKASELAESNPDGNSLATIWEHELAMGQVERAWKHFGTTLKDKKVDERNSALSWQHREAAGAWWDFLQATQPDAPIEELARTVVSLLDPKKSKAFSIDQVQSYIANLRRHAAELQEDRGVNALQAAAETADIHKLTDLSHEIWKQVDERKPSGASALALADYFAGKERWDEAATWYGRAWSRHRSQLFTLILQARSLEKTGQHEDAGRARLVAELWSTGNDRERLQIPLQLQSRGLISAAHEQYAVAQRLVERPYDWVWIFISQAEHQAASAPAEAAKTWNLVRLLCFGDGMILTGDEVEGLYTGHEEVVQRIHHLKATSRISSRDFDAALAEALVAEAAQPAGTKLALELVSYFDEAGAKEHGDQVFEKLWSRRQRVLDDFPRAAEFHEQLAVMGAACTRKLDQSLVHAQRAVRLRPKQLSSLLALARVHLARGEGGAARKHLAEALAIEPMSPEAAKVQTALDKSPVSPAP
jgi:hypothetical protein